MASRDSDWRRAVGEEDKIIDNLRAFYSPGGRRRLASTSPSSKWESQQHKEPSFPGIMRQVLSPSPHVLRNATAWDLTERLFTKFHDLLTYCVQTRRESCELHWSFSSRFYIMSVRRFFNRSEDLMVKSLNPTVGNWRFPIHTGHSCGQSEPDIWAGGGLTLTQQLLHVVWRV